MEILTLNTAYLGKIKEKTRKLLGGKLKCDITKKKTNI